MRCLSIFLLFILLPLSLQAQVLDNGFISSDSNLELSPTYPSPNESFTATLNDYSGSIGAEINWSYNGKSLPEQKNARSITLTAGEAGAKGIVKAVLVYAGGSTRVFETAVTPIYLDIIIEPQTHVPAFYQGRALPSTGSTVNATALLGTPTVSSASYYYTWKINNKVHQGGPLRGGNEIAFVMPQDSASVLSLEVSTLLGEPVASRAVSIPSVSPKLLFYEVSTLYGLEPKAITSSFSLISNSATLRAEPYFLSSTVFNQPNILSWKVAGEEIGITGANPYEVTLQKTGFPGTTDIRFHVRSTDILLQGAEKGISVSI
jgi:hypothetical protein